MLVVTSNSIPGREVQSTVGLVRGSAIRTRHVFADFSEWLRNLVGAELHHYTKMLAESREQAIDRMIDDARRRGATAIIGLQLELSNIASGAAEVLAYGTGVVLKPE